MIDAQGGSVCCVVRGKAGSPREGQILSDVQRGPVLRRSWISRSLIGLPAACSARGSGCHKNQDARTERDLHQAVKQKQKFIHDTMSYL